MIKHCDNLDYIDRLCANLPPNPYICTILCLSKLYTKDNLCDIYVQYNNNDRPTAVFSKFSGTITLYALDKQFDKDELTEFVSFIGCERFVCQPNLGLSKLQSIMQSGHLMRLDRNIAAKTKAAAKAANLITINHSPSPRDIYAVLSQQSGDSIQINDYSGWYVDLSHRLRHGFAKAVVINVDGQPVSCALTNALCHNAALLGGIATLPTYCGMGYGKMAVNTICNALPDKSIFLFCSEHNIPFYQKCGFVLQA